MSFLLWNCITETLDMWKYHVIRAWLYQEHAECFSHNAVEQIQRGISGHHEEVGQEEELSTAVVQQSVVLTAEERLIRVLTETERDRDHKLHCHGNKRKLWRLVENAF